jgi:dynein light intermediate chain 1, cytosolic
LTDHEQDRNAHSSPDPSTEEADTAGANMAKNMDNDQLQNFFSGLMNRKAGGS